MALAVVVGSGSVNIEPSDLITPGSMRCMERTAITTPRLDDSVPTNRTPHPIRIWLNDALERMAITFTRMYESDATVGRPRS